MGNNTQGQNILNREFSSGGIVFRKDKDKIFWLVRKTTASKLFPKSYWMLPKGWLDDDGDFPGPMASGKVRATEEILQNTAIREVGEETGVKAAILNKIKTVKFTYTHPVRGRILKFITYYLMEWVSNLPQGFDFETSEVSWLTYNEAHKTLSFKDEKQVLEDANKLLASVAQRKE